MKRVIVWVLILAALGAGGYFGYRWYAARQSPPTVYRTAVVRKMDIAQTIAATGTVVPEDVIDVGAQVNGQIAEFGKDVDGKTVDYRSVVKEGAVLAKIDDALYRADLASSQAQRAQAQAQVTQAQASQAQAQALIQTGEANREQARAKLEQTRRDWDRAQRLANTTALSKADYDASQSAFEQAQAGVSVAEASITQAKATEALAKASEVQAQAQVAQADALVERTTRNVAYCVINSPVSGVIIDKRVEIGQTVVASLNAPSLFLLAKDLSKMEVLVQVNEADIGSVTPGQAVAFSVDAFPTRRFKGVVRKVRLNATMTQNVVTYTVEISTDNADLKLLPYLTANVKFDVAHRDGVLGAPNSALRWTPRGVDAPDTGGRGGKADADGMKPGTLWVLKDGKPQSVSVKAGLSDGAVTEVQGESVAEGMEVIVGEQTADRSASAATTNPFAPQNPFGRRPTTATGAGGTGGAGGAGGAGGTGGTGGGGTGGGSGRPRP